MLRVIGIDLSTNWIGISLLEINPEKRDTLRIVKADFLNLEKTKNLIDKAILVKDFFFNNYKEEEINYIFIEEPLQNFSSGFSNINTLMKLSKFSGIVSFILYVMLGIEPQFLHPSSARKLAWGTIPSEEKNKKLYIYNKVIEKFPEFSKYVVMKKTKSGIPTIADHPTFDLSDSITVGYAGLKTKLLDEK